ncbi:hypothetical protein BC834DRAFT_261932 [Gloeopeniophorella convolvens]|nr:hypothetical protein BC834DRAFT_261932 [Gloeopeniophorella convolvens]
MCVWHGVILLHRLIGHSFPVVRVVHQHGRSVCVYRLHSLPYYLYHGFADCGSRAPRRLCLPPQDAPTGQSKEPHHILRLGHEHATWRVSEHVPKLPRGRDADAPLPAQLGRQYSQEYQVHPPNDPAGCSVYVRRDAQQGAEQGLPCSRRQMRRRQDVCHVVGLGCIPQGHVAEAHCLQAHTQVARLGTVSGAEPPAQEAVP